MTYLATSLKLAKFSVTERTADDSRPRYSDETIFKMAVVRHLEFSKFGILVSRPVSERHSASSHKILH